MQPYQWSQPGKLGTQPHLFSKGRFTTQPILYSIYSWIRTGREKFSENFTFLLKVATKIKKKPTKIKMLLTLL